MECLLSLMDVRDLLATLGHEYNYPHFRLMLRDVEPSTSMPIDYRHAFLIFTAEQYALLPFCFARIRVCPFF